MIKPYTDQIKVKEQELQRFLQNISAGYREYNVSYHNDLHGFDVAQMSYIILEGENGLRSKASLTACDCLATMIGAACHDFKHDGFTN